MTKNNSKCRKSSSPKSFPGGVFPQQKATGKLTASECASQELLLSNTPRRGREPPPRSAAIPATAARASHMGDLQLQHAGEAAGEGRAVARQTRSLHPSDTEGGWYQAPRRRCHHPSLLRHWVSGKSPGAAGREGLLPSPWLKETEWSGKKAPNTSPEQGWCRHRAGQALPGISGDEAELARGHSPPGWAGTRCCQSPVRGSSGGAPAPKPPSGLLCSISSTASSQRTEIFSDPPQPSQSLVPALKTGGLTRGLSQPRACHLVWQEITLS